jgi:FKBP-type peptidyl-prolyl cis-trans isomerase
MKKSFNNYVGIVVALAVAGFMFYGMSYIYSKIISNNQSESEKTTMNDLKIETIAEGSGDVAENGDNVYVNYVGTLEDGTEFDNSYKRGEPIDFILGTGRVIQGWEKGILGMKVGEKRKLTIPPNLAYGPNGQGPIPPNSTLLFDVELVKVIKAAK